MKRAWSEEVKDVFPNCFELWNKLPNELKAMVCQKMDAQTGADFMNCGRVEAKLAREFVRNKVNIRVKYMEDEENEPETMMVEMREARTNNFQLSWWISAEPIRKTKVVFTSAKPQTLVQTRKTVEATLSMILRQILTEPMFIVKNLEFQLGDYIGRIKLGSIEAVVECIIFNGCFYQRPVDSILGHYSLRHKAALGASFHDFDRIFFFESVSPSGFDHYIYDYPEMSRLVYSLQQNPPMTFTQAQEKVKKICELTFDRYNFVDRHKADNKLELPKTTNDIMFFRAAYYYQPNSVPYLRTTDDRFNKKIAFLKDGIDGFLNDYQLTILSLYYFVRLFRYEPAIAKIEEKALIDLEDMSRQQGSVDCYNKLVSKIEALLPLP